MTDVQGSSENTGISTRHLPLQPSISIYQVLPEFWLGRNPKAHEYKSCCAAAKLLLQPEFQAPALSHAHVVSLCISTSRALVQIPKSPQFNLPLLPPLQDPSTCAGWFSPPEQCVLVPWEEMGEPRDSRPALPSASWLQGALLREFICKELESLHQACVNCGVTACRKSCRLDRGRILVLNPAMALVPRPGAMQEQWRYQTGACHQHGRGQSTLGSAPAPHPDTGALRKNGNGTVQPRGGQASHPACHEKELQLHAETGMEPE